MLNKLVASSAAPIGTNVRPAPCPLTGINARRLQHNNPIFSSNPAFAAPPVGALSRVPSTASMSTKSNPLHKPAPVDTAVSPFVSNPLHVQSDPHAAKPLPKPPPKTKVRFFDLRRHHRAPSLTPSILTIVQDELKPKGVRDDKRKDTDRPLSPRDGSAEISGPMNVQHKVHVNKDFEWTGNDIFDLSEKLGEGCVPATDSREFRG